MTTLAAVTVKRSTAIDNLRGLAIVLMILDHVLVVFDGPAEIRLTLTRISMPLFFLIAGHLAHRLSYRLVGIGLTGIALPLVVAWIDNPNVLFWIALFIPVIVFARRSHLSLVCVILFALTIAANYNIGSYSGSYQPAALLAIMALGAMTTRETFVRVGSALPQAFSYPGRYPLSLYVAHILILEGIVSL